MDNLTCQRCGHEWTPRTQVPQSCPNCKNRKWNVVLFEKVNVNAATDPRDTSWWLELQKKDRLENKGKKASK